MTSAVSEKAAVGVRAFSRYWREVMGLPPSSHSWRAKSRTTQLEGGEGKVGGGGVSLGEDPGMRATAYIQPRREGGIRVAQKTEIAG